MTNGCIVCERYPVVHINGEGMCGHHAEQLADFSSREAPPIAFAPRVKTKPQGGSSSSGSPRHYK